MTDNKKMYTAPSAQVVEFGEEDIVRTSNTTKIHVIEPIFADEGVQE